MPNPVQASELRFRVVSLAINLPGPMAAYRLTQFGARVSKIEPPQGDPVAQVYPELYRKLSQGQDISRLDLKSTQGRTRLNELLAGADLLLTSSRPSSLKRLGLGREELQSRFPRLCQVAIVGFDAPDEERAGHDLNYQALAGLLDPPHMPRALVADYAGAERAVSAALALLLARAASGVGGFAAVSLHEAARAFADPLQHGATRPGGRLGGGLAAYGLYRTRSGWLALGALEGSFIAALKTQLDLTQIDRANLEKIFLTRSSQEWEDWGRQHDIPIAAVHDLEN